MLFDHQYTEASQIIVRDTEEDLSENRAEIFESLSEK